MAQKLWLKRGVGITLGTSSYSGEVATWADQSGSGNDVVRSSAGGGGLWSSSDMALQFNGITGKRYMSSTPKTWSDFATVTAYEGYVVFKPDNASALSNADPTQNPGIIGDIAQGQGVGMNGGDVASYNYSSGYNVALIANSGARVIHRIGFRVDGGKNYIRNINTGVSSSASTGELPAFSAALTIGYGGGATTEQDSFFTGKIYEVIIFNAVLSAPDRAYWDGYVKSIMSTCDNTGSFTKGTFSRKAFR